MNGITVAISVLAAIVSLLSIRSSRRTLRDIHARTAPTIPPRHAVIRNNAGPRQQPRGTMHLRDRIPVQVPPEVEARNARTIEGYDEYGKDDDLLMRPFAPPAPTHDTPVVVAVP